MAGPGTFHRVVQAKQGRLHRHAGVSGHPGRMNLYLLYVSWDETRCDIDSIVFLKPSAMPNPGIQLANQHNVFLAKTPPGIFFRAEMQALTVV